MTEAHEWPDHSLKLPAFSKLVGPEASDAINDYALGAVMVFQQYFREFSAPGGARTAFGHLANDLRIFPEEVFNYEGRSAARTARSVFESCVTIADVCRSQTTADRYMAHESVVAVLLAEHAPGLDLLRGREARTEKDRLDQVRQVHEPLRDAALLRYGKGFRSGWASANLYDRCVTLGWEDRYDAYRILSAVTHGSAGGLLGNSRATELETIHRIGPSLELIPLAVLETVRSVDALASHAEDEWPDFDGSEIHESGRGLLGFWPRIRRMVLELDTRIWPDVGAPDPIAVLALYPKGERWFWHDPLHQVVVVAEPPSKDELPPEQVEALNSLRDDPRRLSGGPGGRPITIVLAGVRVRPREGAAYFHERSLLVPEESIAVDAFGSHRPGRATH